jgi:hypothetical protein
MIKSIKIIWFHRSIKDYLLKFIQKKNIRKGLIHWNNISWQPHIKNKLRRKIKRDILVENRIRKFKKWRRKFNKKRNNRESISWIKLSLVMDKIIRYFNFQNKLMKIKSDKEINLLTLYQVPRDHSKL